MRFKVILSLIAVVAVAMLAAGCGGSSDSSSGGSESGSTSAGSTDGTTQGGDGTTENASGKSPSGPPLTKAEYIKKGDAICGGIPNEYEKLRQELLKGPEKNKATPEKINEVAAVPPIFTAVGKFEELNPPKGDEAEAEAIVDALEAAGKGLEKEPNAPLVGAGSPYEEFVKLTKAYGFTFCNQL